MSSTMLHLHPDGEDDSVATYHTARTSSFHSTANTIDAFLDEKANEVDDEVTMRESVVGGKNIFHDHATNGDDGSISRTTKVTAGCCKKLKSKRPHDNSLRLQHYLLQMMLRQLHVGDNGNTYLAELKHNKTPTLYAIKVMRKEDSRKLWEVETERNVLKSLDHPFLPYVYTDVDSKELAFLVMDFCPRGDLRTLLRRNHLREEVAKFYAAEVLLAMEYLHEHGIIYRGLKTENVLIKKDGHVMLSSFDHAIWRPSLPTIQSRNSSFMSCFERFVYNVPGFESLESNGGSRALHNDVAADWYAYGVLLYELLFRMTPFKAHDDRTTCFNVAPAQRLKFPQQPAVSPAARDLLKRLLEKNPKRRLGCRGGAAEVKQHPFFHGTNFALLRERAPRWLTPPELENTF